MKPKFNLTIVEDTVVELVFDVNPDFLVERGESGSYNINPRKGLKFVGAFDNIYGSLTGEIELPEGIDNLISIQVNLFSVGSSEPIWTTSLEDDKVTFEIATLPEGEYWLEATMTLFDQATLTLDTDPFRIEAGKTLDVFIQK